MITTKWELQYPKFIHDMGITPFRESAKKGIGDNLYNIDISDCGVLENVDSLYIYITINLPTPDLRVENFAHS